MPLIPFRYILSGNETVKQMSYYECDNCHERIFSKPPIVLPIQEIEMRNKLTKVYCSYCESDILKFENSAKTKAGFITI